MFLSDQPQALALYLLWERGEVKHLFYGARLINFSPLTSIEPHLDGLITDFMLDETVQA